MKKLAMTLLAFTIFSTVRVADACSLLRPDTEPIHARMREAIARRLRVSPSAISPDAITASSLLLPRGLEADCTGLEAAVHAAIYSVEATEDDRTCTSWGFVAVDGWTGNGAVRLYPQMIECRP